MIKFDTVDHGILLKKLDIYGIIDMSVDFSRVYFSKRSQCISLGITLSDKEVSICSLPQETVLVPILFNLINDLENVSNKFKYVLFTDDINILYLNK